MESKIDKQNIEDVYPMSDISRGMIFHSLKDTHRPVYRNQMVYRLRDQSFDPELFRKSVSLMVEKHSLLRTGFKMFGFEEPLQIVYKKIPLDIEHSDISLLSPTWQQEEIEGFLEADKQISFDFNAARPLWRMKFFTLAKGNILVVWTVHHAIIDGWSSASLVTELNNTYLALKKDPGFVPGKLGSSYKDYVIQEKAAKKNQQIREFWKNQLADYKRFEFPHTGEGKDSGNVKALRHKIERSLEPGLLEQLKKAAVNYHTSIKNLCFAAYVYMLNMLSFDNDIVVGLITNNRPICRDGDKIIGCFLNTVLVRLKIPANIRWKEFIHLVTKKLHQLKNYDMLSFYEITRMMGEESRERNPIVDTIFSYVDFHVYHDLQEGNEAAAVERISLDGVNEFSLNFDDSGATNTLFDFSVDTTNGNFLVHISYSTSILNDEAVSTWTGWYETILDKFIQEPETLISRQQLLTGEERQQLLYEFNNTQREYPREKPIQGLFEEQAQKKPHHIAAVAPPQTGNRTYMTDMTYISYRELDKRSDGLARLLIEKGVQSDTIVGIMVERGLEMLFGLLAILKAGGAYLSIDLDYPQDRINYMLKDSGAEILLTSKEITALPSPQALYLSAGHHPIFPSSLPSNLAYIIYTSGSTGKPKGVLVEHGNVVRLVKNCTYIDFVPDDRLLLTGAIGFDITTFEIWYPLLNGLVLVQADQDTIMDARKLRDFVLRNKITLLHLIPQLFNQLADQEPGIFAGLNYFLVGGDVVQPHFVNKIRKTHKNLNILHMYGPTENTTFSTFYPVEKEYKETIPIGKPISNSIVYILDMHGQLQPIGVVGELYTGGDGITRGYLNNPELTAEKFDHDLWDLWDYQDEEAPFGHIINAFGENKKKKVPGKKSYVRLEGTRGLAPLPKKDQDKYPMQSCNHASMHPCIHVSMPSLHHPITPIPHSPYSPIYKTGDLARWLPDGNIEFLGRIDQQVKIRGFRVELGEIENRLQGHKDVKMAVVVLTGKKPDHKLILAYVVMEQDKKLNSSQLKEYLLQTLPGYMIPTHFVQLESIPLTASGKIDRKALPEPEVKTPRDEAYMPPGNEIEKQLVEIWSGLLARDNIGTNDNFFALGGDSIQAIQAAARMNEAGYKIEIRDILQGKSIAQLALVVKKKDRTAEQSMVIGTVPLTPIQKRFFQEVSPGSRHHFNQAVMLYSQEGFSKETVEKVFTKLVEHHDALRMVFAVSSEAMMQENRGIEGKLFDLEVFSLEDIDERIIEKEIQDKAGQIQGSMDLENGPLVKLALFKTRQGDHLLVVIHHLVVDGISWRILFEDFSTGYRQQQQGKEIKFPDKTDSFKYWSGKLSEYAVSGAIRELEYWKTVEMQAQKVQRLPGPGNLHLPEEKKCRYTETTVVNLNQQETKTLLINVNHAYNTDINDILLTALGMSVTGWAGLEKVLLDLESHGREPIIEGIDITRTVGWFTAQYPVILDMSHGEDLAYTIKSVKETLRRIPNKGTGYGILRYLTPDEKKGGYKFQCEPGISFNYLGQWQEENPGGMGRISPYQGKDDGNPAGEQSHTLVINGMTAAGELKFLFSYDIREYDKKSITNLASGFCTILRRIIAHCSQKKESEFTPSDLGCQKISIDEFTRIIQSISARLPGNPRIEALYPLSPMQSGMLYHALKDPDTDIYFVQTLFQLEGQIEKDRFNTSVNQLLGKYDILRTIFFYEDLEEPLQAVLKHRHTRVFYKDITYMSEDEKTLYIQEFKKKDEKRGFHLGKDILMRFLLFRTGIKSYHLLWSFHHIIMDGWCLGIVYNELIQIYRHLKQGKTGELGTLGAVTPYKNYIQWLEKQDKAAGLHYWRGYLEGFDQQTGLPQQVTGPGEDQGQKNKPYQPREHDLIIREELILSLKSITAADRVTLGTLFQALWGVLLQKYNNCNDVVFGTVVSGRPAEIQGIEQMVGLFINTVPVRIKTPGKQKFSQLLKILQEKNTLTRSYEYLPLADIQAQSALKTNLLDHIMAFENYPIHEEVKKTGIQGETGRQNQYPDIDFNVKDVNIQEQTNYRFNVIVMPANPFLVKFVYDARVYDDKFIKSIALHFKEVLQQVAHKPDTGIEKIEIITRVEKKQILFDFNSIEKLYPEDKTIHRLFEEQVKRTPDHTSAVGPPPVKNRTYMTYMTYISYRELNERSNRLARVLIEKGVQSDAIVGIMVKRSVEMIVGILGILKADCAYVPLDPKAPPARSAYILNQCSASKLLTTRELSGETAGCLNVCPDRVFIDDFEPGSSPLPLVSPASMAYVIFTSGSTGKPKGVPITHANLSPLLHWGYHCLGLNSQDRTLQNLAYYFDWSVWEIFITITSGASLFIVPGEILLNPGKCADIMLKNNVTVLHVTPSQYQYLLQVQRKSETLKYLFLGAEKLTVELVKRSFASINDDCRVFNMYGPTEAAIISAVLEICPEDEEKYSHLSSIPIGKPIANAALQVLDRNLNLCPINVTGELYIGGDGVADGYLNNPELTAEKFDHDLWDLQDYHDGYHRSYRSYKTYIIYKTGDLARWLPDGNIEFLGRIDHQVKVRGQRIEPGEIENHLVQHETVKEAVVTVYQGHNGDKYLCAYVLGETFVKEDENTWIGKLKEYLSKQLPEYMIPSHFIKISHIPLTPNGKVDRKALPGPEIKSKKTYVPPRNEIEKKLAAIWSGILGNDASYASQFISSPGIDDNFFELGGHSLKAMILTAKIHQAFHVKLSLTEVFRRQTIREMAKYIANTAKNQYASIEPVEKKEYYPLSSAQKRLYFIQQLDINSTGYNMPLFLPLGKEIGKNKLETALKRLIERHESLRTSFEQVKEEPVQRVHEEVEFEIEYDDLQVTGAGDRCRWEDEGTRGLAPLPKDPAERKAQSAERKEEHRAPCVMRYASTIKNFVRPFDLSRAPLLRSGLIKQADGSHTWMLDIHHIVSDGTSQGILTEEFLSLYNDEKPGPLRLDYKDFSGWQNRLFASGVIKDQEEYWLRLYSGRIPRLELPTDHKRPEIFTFRGNNYSFKLERKDAIKFRALSIENGGTLYMNILAALNTLFYKYSGQTDIIIGSGSAGRPHEDLQRIIGMFVNTLALRCFPRAEKTYKSFLKEVIAHSINAFENQDVQFDELVDKLNLERDPSRNPLFDISMVVENMRQPAQNSQLLLALNDKNPSPLEVELEDIPSKFDMTFFITEANEDVYINLEYYTGIFKETTIKRMVSHFKNIIKAVVKDSTLKLKDIDMITGKEKQQVLYEFNDTVETYPKDKTIHELFEIQVRKTPQQIALVHKDENLTYGQLKQRANRLANYLYFETRDRYEAMVGILMERSIDQVIALLGILKSGKAYLPIDPSLPEARIGQIIEDAGPGIIISHKRWVRILNRLQWECKCFHTFLCLDSTDIYSEQEREKSRLMDEMLWDAVADSATDDITGGGWFTSYTGEPFTREEMDEYGDNILKKIMSLLHPDMQVLEIGCGSGISMYCLAPFVGSYYAVDISNKIIEENRKRVREQGYKNITLETLPAHEIERIPHQDFDLVIINSVVQSFHGHNYLRKVMKKAIHLSAQQGYLFIGDILDQDLKKNLIREMTAYKYSRKGTAKTKTDWSADMFVSRAFFEDLLYDLPEISDIEFTRKIYTIENELTKFRYDTLITIDKTGKKKNRIKPKQKYQHDIKVLEKFPSYPPAVPVKPGDIAYVIYTSGTTGLSKGVMIEHGNVVRLIKSSNYIDYIDSREEDRYLLTGAFSFDITTFEVWGPLLNGIGLYMVDKDVILAGEKLQEAIVKNRISIIHFIPQLFRQYLESCPGLFETLRLMLIGGDLVSPGAVAQLKNKYPHLEILHMYGPTENTTFSTFFPVKKNDDQLLPIGKPLSNSTVYILDQWHRPQPPGIFGELCTGGDGVARGYLNNPELTLEKFINYKLQITNYKQITNYNVQNYKQKINQKLLRGVQGGGFLEKSPPGRRRHKLYKTGDLARWLPDGNIQFGGRIDHQVKIRGFRVELGEIENRLLNHPLIKETVIMGMDEEISGDKFLCAYIVPDLPVSFDNSQLQEYLSQWLPDYMIPSYYVTLEKLPLTTSGKVDRRALPAPEIKVGETYVAPGNKIEEKLVEIWAEVLGLDRTVIGIDDNFFALGGQSLKATVLVSRISRELQVKIPLAEIFKTPFIRALASRIHHADQDKFPEMEPGEKKEYYELSYNQKRLWVIHCMNPDSSAYHMPGLIHLGDMMKLDVLKKAFAALFERHDSFRTGFREIHNQPVQFIRETVEIPIKVMDISGRGAAEKQQETMRIMQQTTTRPFDLQSPPLFRSVLIKQDKENYVLVYNMHHIISDGWSMEILKSEFSRIYTDYLRGNEPHTEPLQFQYRDFAGWQNREVRNPETREQAHRYWQKKLTTGLPVLELTHHYRAGQTGKRTPFAGEEGDWDKGSRYRCAASPIIKERIMQMARESQTTPFMVLFTMYNLLMAYLSGQDHITAAVINAGRQHVSLQHIVGYFIYPLLIKTRVNIDEGFEDLLSRTNREVSEAFQHQAYPLELVLEEMKMGFPEVAIAFNMLNVQNISPGIELDSFEFYHLESTQDVKFDIVLFVMEHKNGIEFFWDYRRTLFSPKTIETIAQNYLELMENLTGNNEEEPG